MEGVICVEGSEGSRALRMTAEALRAEEAAEEAGGVAVTAAAAAQPVEGSIDHGVTQNPWERRFSPYDFNGGTTVVLAGKDFALAAGDTRMSTGYQILSRQQTKLFGLTSSSVLTAAGCASDVTTLTKYLARQVQTYSFDHGKEMSTPALAQLLSNTLYYRRFFPYYSFCMLAGLDEEGKGAVYGYDAIGSFKRDVYGAMGSGQNYIVPLLDNLVGLKNRSNREEYPELTQEEAINIVKEAFVAAGERDIYTGDSVQIDIITSDGVRREIFELKKD